MTKKEYLSLLKNELEKQDVADAEEIVTEYEQHFAFKLADGFGEEEIAKKLGDPAAIASQFAQIKTTAKPGGKKAFLVVWFTFLGFLEAILYTVFAAFTAGVFAGAAASAAIGVMLIGRINVYGMILPMPYAGAILLGLCMIALGVILTLAGISCAAYLRQIIRASARYKKNAISGNALPPLPFNPQFAPKTRRALRSIMGWSVAVFGITFVVGFAVLAILSGAWGFWHAYGWFVS